MKDLRQKILSKPFSFEILFPKLCAIVNDITVIYVWNPTGLKHPVVGYEVLSFCNQKNVNEFKFFLRKAYRSDFANLNFALQNLKSFDKTIILDSLIDEAQKVFDIVEEETDFTSDTVTIYKKFKSILYSGPIKGYAFNTHQTIDFRIEEFAKAWITVIQEFQYKLYQISLNSDLIGLNVSMEKSDNSLLSFTYKYYLNHPERLKDFNNALKAKNLIDKRTSIISFAKVFSGKNITTSIKWTGGIEMLAYMVRQLIKRSLILDTKNRHWDIVIRCFKDGNENSFLRNKLRSQHIPAKSKIIDTILNCL